MLSLTRKQLGVVAATGFGVLSLGYFNPLFSYSSANTGLLAQPMSTIDLKKIGQNVVKTASTKEVEQLISFPV